MDDAVFLTLPGHESSREATPLLREATPIDRETTPIEKEGAQRELTPIKQEVAPTNQRETTPTKRGFSPAKQREPTPTIQRESSPVPMTTKPAPSQVEAPPTQQEVTQQDAPPTQWVPLKSKEVTSNFLQRVTTSNHESSRSVAYVLEGAKLISVETLGGTFGRAGEGLVMVSYAWGGD